jgi:mevalonate kinase
VRIEDSQMGSSLDWSVEECLEAGRRARALWREGSRGGDFRALFDHVRGDSFKKAAVGCVLDRLGARGGAALSIGSTIPLGSGLGSSSALSVALAKALSELHGAGLSPEEVNALAFEAERFKHGNPSGGDNTACCHGGLVWFQRGEPDTVLSLRGEVPYELDGFVLVHVGTPERTS